MPLPVRAGSAATVASTNHLLLIGMMGSGKTTIGRRLAERLGRPFFDSDAQVEQATGRSVAEIFATAGEAAFRAEETKALAAAVRSDRPAVIAVAGGAVLSPENRQIMRGAGQIVWLRASPAVLVRRLGDGSGRPLLAGDVPGNVARLVAEREPAYTELAEVIVDVDHHSAAETTEVVLAALQRRIPVPLGERSYEVVVGPGARHQLGSELPTSARRAAVVTQAAIGIEVEPGIESLRVELPEGESAKSLAEVERLCRAFAGFGLTRDDVVIAVGGGVVTDTAGFAAASYHRGVAVVHVATTLLGQVDAAIGGKTGVNIPEGKNLVGAFWQPSAVICDVDLLSTLPEREWRSGRGELAKYAFLGIENLDELPLVEQVASCVALKAEVVAGDERESGRRAILNYGHTLAHALEAAGFAENPAGRLDLRHGEAVGIGLVFAARLARLLGRIDAARVSRHLEVVGGYGLPTTIPAEAPLGELLEIMGRDKKATDGLTFVLDGPNGVEVVRDVDRAAVIEALELTSARAAVPAR